MKLTEKELVSFAKTLNSEFGEQFLEEGLFCAVVIEGNLEITIAGREVILDNKLQVIASSSSTR